MKAVVVVDSDDAVVAAMASAIRFFIFKVLLRSKDVSTEKVRRVCGCEEKSGVPIPTWLPTAAKKEQLQGAHCTLSKH